MAFPLLRLTAAPLLLGAALIPVSASTGLERLEGCRLLNQPWADGDSFPIRTANGQELTVRLYGADCLEMHVRDDSDARRLRAQRRYFGLSGDPAVSITQAKDFGAQAASRVRTLLAEPFTVHTARADARGDSRYPRVYAFVQTAAGRDLAAQLVEEGLARAFGVYRATPDGRTADDYRARLQDLELAAAGARRGIWAATDWSRLPEERQAQRSEDQELSLATSGPAKGSRPVDPNTAGKSELMTLPGIGEVLADRIIEARAQGRFRKAADLARVPGIGPALLEKITPLIVIAPDRPRAPGG
jgi:competence ComEA-like helix-hairpin-helix protein